MARNNKYKTIKVHPWTIVAILGFIAAIVLLIIFTSPNDQRRLYDSFRASEREFNELIDTNKFDRNHAFSSISESQLLRQIARDELVIVFLGNPNDQNSFHAIQDVNGRFRGFSVPGGETVLPSMLYSENIIRTIRYLRIEQPGIESLVERINDRLNEDSDLVTTTNVPTLLAFRNNELIAEVTVLVGVQGIRNIRDFYIEVFEFMTE